MLFAAVAWAGAAKAMVTSPGSATPWEDSLGVGEGWMLTAGWFFKDTMFYSNARGGVHVAMGRVLRVSRNAGVWIGSGGFSSSGSFRSADSSFDEYDTSFRGWLVHTDVGLVTPWFPFPVSLVFYSHSTRIEDRALSGPFSGCLFKGSDSGAGLGMSVQIVLEFFLNSSPRPPRGPALVVAYMGFWDLTAKDIETVKEGGGAYLVHKDWKPIRGESLRAGVEYEF